MVIIETVEEFSNLCELTKNKLIFIIPLMTDDNAHPQNNEVCLVSIVISGSDEQYILAFNHNETINLPGDLIPNFWNLGYTHIVTPDKKKWNHLIGGNTMTDDVNGQEFVITGQVTDDEKFYTPVMRKMYSMYRNQKNINKAIPLMDLVKYFDAYHAHMKEAWMNLGVTSSLYPHRAWEFHNNSVIPALEYIEEAGICVNPELFEKYFPGKSKRNIKPRYVGPIPYPLENHERYMRSVVYTEYHPYSVTGRITNSFDGINYAALKKGETRQAFISRFEQGSLVSIDFMSFHPFIIAELIGYSFPEPVYQFLAKQYFKVDNPSDEEIKAAKIHTMKLFYDDEQPTNIEFLQKMYEYRNKMWEEMQLHGKLRSPQGREISLSSIDDPTPGKVFSYLIQMREMEISIQAICQIRPLLGEWWEKVAKSRIVLYTYDSILLDYCHEDGPELLRNICEVMEQSGHFPVKIEAGKTFGTLRDVTNLVKTKASRIL